jgi:UPF0755 protein
VTLGRGRPVGGDPAEPPGTIRSGGYSPRGRVGGTIVRGRGFRDLGDPAPSGRSGVLRFVLFILGLAAVVVIVLVTVAGPLIGDTVYGFAVSRPESMRWPFVATIVEDRLGADLDSPAGSDPREVPFVVPSGASASDIGADLEAAALVRDKTAFVYLVITQERSTDIEAGTYRLRATMTPQEILDSLRRAPVQTVTILLKEGLRLEQITAKLETLPLKMDVSRFYELVKHPPATLLAEFPWLDLPDGASLEGFLAPDTYEVWEDVTPTDLIRTLVDNYHRQLGDDLLARIAASGRSLYEVVTLASMVDKEARLDVDRPLVAGVFQSRLDKGMLLGSDSTVIYAYDTIALRELPVPDWVSYFFWRHFDQPYAEFQVPEDLQGYQTYQVRGLPSGPICTPRVLSVEAALAPDTSTGYLYFINLPDGSGVLAYAKTLAEHQANLRKYGYLP